MKIVNLCNKAIEYSFYLLFFFVPIVVISDTSELFEFNKLWFTFIISIIVGAAWFSKMIVKKQFKIQRTILDIPIALFLLSQVVSTIVSLDPHTSIWGYYTRFNGGLLSILAYIFLYYAFVTNLDSIHFVKRLLGISLASGLFVSLWGLPSHFGYDPTCLVFRGTLDVSCWTSDFQPKVRIFSTLGQPDWMGAYLAVLIPIALAYFINSVRNSNARYKISKLKWLGYILLAGLFYYDLLLTKSRAAIIASYLSIAFFFFIYLWIRKNELKTWSLKAFAKTKFQTITFLVIFLLSTFFAGIPFFAPIQKLTYPEIKSALEQKKAEKKAKVAPTPAPEQPHVQELGGTDSKKIRLIVWEGAFDAWKNNPIFGTGVETFAFAYYKYRPPAHNLTSEWNFLYNKAHNEYLNYLATTGLFGLFSYASVFLLFLLFVFNKALNRLRIKELSSNLLIVIALVSGYISILISNFFGFSVVIINIYYFLIPAFVFVLLEVINKNKIFVLEPKIKQGDKKGGKTKHFKDEGNRTSGFQKISIAVILIISTYLLNTLYNDWNADKSYALGQNLDRAGQYEQAYPNLKNAQNLRPSEPMFLDELSINNAVLSIMVLQQQKDVASGSAELADKLAKEAIALTNKVTSEHPNNVVFAKTRVRVFYTLAQANPQYLPFALQAIQKAATLAPSDANISYNLGVLYGQNGQVDKAIETLANTTKLKKDYRDAYYALGIFYRQASLDKNNKVVKPELNQKGIEQMNFILKSLAPGDQMAKQAIETWTK